MPTQFLKFLVLLLITRGNSYKPIFGSRSNIKSNKSPYFNTCYLSGTQFSYCFNTCGQETYEKYLNVRQKFLSVKGSGAGAIDIPIPAGNPYVRYTSKYWFTQLVNIPSSRILRLVRHHLLFSTFWSSLLTYLYLKGWLGAFVIHNMIPWSILSSVLSLLLVFRTNSAYDRFWEGKKLIISVLAKIRSLCMQVKSVVECNNDDSYDKDHVEKNRGRFASLSLAFLPVLLNHLAYENPEYLTEQEQQNEYASIFDRASVENNDVLSPSDRSSILAASNRPLRCLQLMMNTVMALPVAKAHDLLWLDLIALNQLVADMERIVRTPVPMSYSRHTSRFLSLFFFTFPLTLLPSIGVSTVPVTLFFCWAMFSIEEIGHDIENPFDKARRNDLLGVDSLLNRIKRDVGEIFSCPRYYSNGEK
jgi:putative membrane protein